MFRLFRGEQESRLSVIGHKYVAWLLAEQSGAHVVFAWSLRITVQGVVMVFPNPRSHTAWQ